MNKRAIPLNDNAIDTLTPQSCWAIGWIAADGCVYVGKSRSVSIGLSDVDIDVLEKLRSFFGYGGDFYYRDPGAGGYDSNHAMVTLSLRSVRIVQRLVDLGIVPRKSGKLVFPSAILESSEDCLRMFVRGYFEGNGSVSISAGQPKLSFCGSNAFLVKLSELLTQHCKVRLATARVHSQSTAVSELGYKCYSAVQILKWIYGCAGYYCERKWLKYQSVIAATNGKFSEPKWLGESIDGKIPVEQYSTIGGYMKSWDSIQSAADAVGVKTQSIKRALDGIRASAGGFKWKYL